MWEKVNDRLAFTRNSIYFFRRRAPLNIIIIAIYERCSIPFLTSESNTHSNVQLLWIRILMRRHIAAFESIFNMQNRNRMYRSESNSIFFCVFFPSFFVSISISMSVVSVSGKLMLAKRCPAPRQTAPIRCTYGNETVFRFSALSLSVFVSSFARRPRIIYQFKINYDDLC